MRADLFTHPKIVRISSALKADTLRTVGGLMSVWCLFDAHSVDGKLEGYTAHAIDEHLRWPGFSQAMIGVEWMIEGAQGLELPRFDCHNGQSAKRRAQDADRKKEVRKTSAPEADKKRTREEKRREDIPSTNVDGRQPRKIKSKLPEETLPTAEHLAYARQNSLNLSEEIIGFRLYHEKELTLSGSWNSSLSLWLRNAVKFRREAPQQSLIAPTTNKCEHPGCTKNANLRTSKGHRCTEHM